MPNIAFCRPGGSFSSKWVGCWTDMMFYCADNNIGVIDRPAVFHNIHMVRDMCLDVGIGHIDQKPFNGELDYTHSMWIDSDQVWRNRHFQMLLDADEDIVCGWYRINGLGDKGMCVGWYDEKSLIEKGGIPLMTDTAFKEADRNEKGLIDLGAVGNNYSFPWVGLGFTLIKKGVLEKIPYPWFYDDNIRVGDIISNRGDDISFFKKANDCGFKVWLHPDCRVGHEKTWVF